MLVHVNFQIRREIGGHKREFDCYQRNDRKWEKSYFLNVTIKACQHRKRDTPFCCCSAKAVMIVN